MMCIWKDRLANCNGCVDRDIWENAITILKSCPFPPCDIRLASYNGLNGMHARVRGLFVFLPANSLWDHLILMGESVIEVHPKVGRPYIINTSESKIVWC